MPTRPPWANEYGYNFNTEGVSFKVLYGQGLPGPPGVQATLRVIGSSPTTAGLPPSADVGDAWVTGPESDSRARTVWLWNAQYPGGPGGWFEAFRFVAPPGPKPNHQWSGTSLRFERPDGSWGPYVNLRGPQGIKGDPGNYLGLAVNGFGNSLSERPANPGVNNYVWGLRNNGVVTLYIWDANGGQWSVLGEITAPEAYPVANRIYVQKNGNDANSGASLSTARLTIQGAIARANELGGSGQIYVCPGVYTKPSAATWDVPDGWSIYCEPRACMIVPAPGTEQSNVFSLSNGTFIHGFTCSGFVHDDLDNPTTGFIAVFKPGAQIDRLPYLMNCVAFRPQPMALISDPNPSPGGGVLMCDATVLDPNSTFKQAVAFAATGSSSNGVFYCAKNLALIHLVSGVMIWHNKAFLALGGGEVTLSNCETQFGEDAMVADGYGKTLVVSRTPTSGDHSAAATLIENAVEGIVDAMWAHLVAQGFTTGWPSQAEVFTRRDAANWLKAIVIGLRRGTYAPIHQFARGLYKVAATGDYWVSTLVPVFAASYLPAFIESFEEMQRRIAALPGILPASVTRANSFKTVLIDALQNPRFRKARSRIKSTSHTFTQAGAGVNRAALPDRFGGAGVSLKMSRVVKQRRGGRVIFSGQDDRGNVSFVGGLVYDARSGLLTGAAFDAAVELRAIEAAIATGGL